uniref:Uncharacterized protein n=1 Tax=Siphoviridae sp. ctzyE57 TaxID=2827982 RepID=A0A8S5SHE4_9CAUD|nr:MAG TPA: hypothetical protein [Siphoviridae sp. ctzyE57]
MARLCREKPKTLMAITGSEVKTAALVDSGAY